MSDWKLEVYWRSPVFLQEWALNLYAAHLEKHYYGGDYEDWRNLLTLWQIGSASQAREWQNEKLRSLIPLAAIRVPYYRERWKHIDWKSISCAEDLRLLPLLERQIIREDSGAFVVEGLNVRKLWIERTSGTTGTALRVYWPKSKLPVFWAVMEVMVRNVAGVAQAIPRAMMGGRPVVPATADHPPYWRYNRRWHQLYLSNYHVSRQTAAKYAEAMRHYGSEWITGYGSSIAALAASALEADAEKLQMRSVIVSGDTLLPGMRAAIEEFFQCRCFDQYGQCEGVCMAMECRQGRMHVVPWVGIVEILRPDGSPCPPGEVGEIIATGLLNDAMPLIRYRLGDYAAWAADQTCTCGNPQPILDTIAGRLDDFIITPGGRRVGRLAGFRRCPEIHSAQLLQDNPHHAYLLIRPGTDYRRSHGLAVRDDICSRIGDMDIDVVEVSEIPRTMQGKTITVVRLQERPEMREVYRKVIPNASL
jgi:phenylacetate-CoA ligase